MKSNVPWSVKGIDPEARIVAKAAAKEAGMTLGEWMNQAIRQIGEGGGEVGGENPDVDGSDHNGAAVTPGVTTDQLRAVVDSLNRLNERLTMTEESLRTQEAQTRQTAAGLGQGLETVYERMKRLERERREGTSEAIQERVERLERGEGDKGRIDGLKRLESALTSMVEALEVTRTEAITKITENEEVVAALADRVDVLDEKLSAGFAEVHQAIDAVGEHLDRTERTAAGVLADAKDASGSDDAEFVAQTSRRLQVLGNEIKRSGDQIRTVEEMVGRLSMKIEAAEQRSAEGIGEVAASLEGLREEVTNRPSAKDADAGEAVAAAARDADTKVSRLQRSYETMMARLDGRAEPEETHPFDREASASGARSAGETPEDLVPADGRDDDFDAAFADLTQDRPQAEGAFTSLSVGTMPLSADSEPSVTAPLGSNGDDSDFPASDDGDDGAPRLTARQKVLLAARARKKRLEAERDGPVDDETGPIAPEAAASSQPLPQEHADAPSVAADAPEVRASEDGQNRKLGAGMLGLLALLVAAMAFAGWTFFGGGDGATEVAPERPESNAQPVNDTPAASSLPEPTSPVPLPNAMADAERLYAQGRNLLAQGQEGDAFRLFVEAADKGYAPAQFRVGHSYYDGLGVEKNLVRAERHLSDAAVSGNVLAMHYLGNLAANDPSGDPNIAAALDWFRQAADYGVVNSAYNLGYLYDPTVEAGLMPVERRDAAEAYYWYSIAAKQGDEPARQEAELVAARLTPEAIAKADARVIRWTPLPISPSVNDGVSLPG